MIFVQANKAKPEDLYSLHIKTVYNFSYRLSGDSETAGVLTEKVFLSDRSNQGKLHLLKLAWEAFLKHHGCTDPKGEDPLQQALLTLPPDLRCTVILRDIMGCSYHQIAVILDKSDFETAGMISEARSRLARSYAKLKIRN
ncbi:MAG TPA: sigma factor-like helix-turn-helix DNA-binding protein [Clostridia bacterium]|nr:sigma factor-like helix-turn-helix DNA-binding protein [Clostridia bacterium]